MSDVILSSSGAIRSLVDGTLRISFDIDPADAQAAFALFGKPGTPVALARVTNEAAVAHDRAQQAEAPADPLPPHKLPTPLSSKVALTCGERSFWRFLEARTGVSSVDKEIAAALVREWCGVESRSDIKPGSKAERAWNTMRADYEHYQRTGFAA